MHSHTHLIDACEGLKVMGAPMGDANWSKAWLQSNAAKVQVHMNAVVELGAHDNDCSAQAAFLILWYSASAKIGHLLRMVPPHDMAEAAVAHDESVLSTLSLLMHTSDPLSLDGTDDDPDEVDALSLSRAQALMPAAAGGSRRTSVAGLTTCGMRTHIPPFPAPFTPDFCG